MRKFIKSTGILGLCFIIFIPDAAAATYDTAKADSLYYLAYDSSLSNPAFAKKAIRRYLAMTKNSQQFQWRQAETYHTLGTIFSFTYQNDSAHYIYQKLLKIADSINSPYYRSEALMGLGNVESIMCHYEQAANYYYQALLIARENNDYYQKSRIYLNLAYIFEEQELNELSLEFVEKSKVYSDSLTDSYYLEMEQQQLRAWYAYKKGNYQKSLKHLSFYEDTLQPLGELYLQIDAMALRIQNLSRLGFADSASHWASKLDSHLQNSTDPYTKSLYSSELADYYTFNKEHNKALKQGHQSLKIAHRIGNKYLVKQAAQKLFFAHNALGNSDSAQYYFGIFNPLTIELAGANTKMDFYNNEYEISRLKNELLQKENERIKSTLKRNRLIGIGFGLIVLILLISGIVILRLLQKVRKTNKQLLQQNNKLEDQKSELARTNQTKDRLFSILAHDLREPFNQLMSVLQLQRDEELDQNTKKVVLEETYKTTQNLSETVTNLLVWSRSQLNGFDTKPEWVELNDILQYLEKELAPTLKAKNITLHCAIPSGFKILADKEQLHIMLRNLAVNAIKFSHKGGTIELKATAKEGVHLLTLRDYGTGMDKETLRQMQNGQGTLTSKPGTAQEKGSGLGINIVRDFIKHHNGELLIESEWEKGTAITLQFPNSNF